MKEKGRGKRDESLLKVKDTKKLDLLGRKIYSTEGLQLRITNDQALLSRKAFNSWLSMCKFKELLSAEPRSEFGALFDKGRAITKASLQAALDAAHMLAATVVTIIWPTS